MEKGDILFPLKVEARAFLASFWECFILKMNEETFVWQAFCETENREREEGEVL